MGSIAHNRPTYQMSKNSIDRQEVSGTVNHHSTILKPWEVHNLNDLINGKLQLG